MATIISEILDLTRPRWSMPVLMTLAAQPCRYTDLQHHIAALSVRAVHARSLTATLRRLQENGLVAHEPDSAGAKYRLTARGKEFVRLLNEIEECGRRHGA